MNYKNLIFSIFFILSLGCVPSTPAMETRSQQTEQEKQLCKIILVEACKKGSLGPVKHLIEKDSANVNAEDNNKATLLHHSSYNGHLKIVKYLVENGADVNRGDGTTEWGAPLIFASGTGHFEVVKCLVENGANINTKNKNDHTPLHSACEFGQTKIAQYLIENGANINAECDRKKLTPLHIACQYGNLELIKYLIENGANIHAENDRKWTPLFVACQYEHLAIVKHLIGKGADVHAKVEMENTLLHIAAFHGRLGIVQYLLKIAPDLIDAQTIDGFTALDIAQEEKKTTVVKLFTQHGVRTVSEKQAEENMKAFFAELDKEASQAQSKSAQKKQKKLENQQRRALQNQNINTNVVKQNNGGVNKQVSKAIEMSPAVINPTINDSVNNDVKPIILADKQIEANAISITSSEPNSIIACEPAIIVSTANAIHNFSSKADTICSLDSCVNNSSVPDNKVIITPKKQQNSIQKPNNKPVQPNQPRQINNGYQVGHDAKLKWPRSLAGAKYDLMRDHLRQLKHWPETTGLDIKQLKGQVGMFRLRVGGYRVLFMVNDAQRRILIHEIGLRKKVYRGL